MAQMYEFPQNNSNNNMKVHLICNTIKAIAGIAVIGYVCKMTRSPWPLVAMIFIPQSNFKTENDDQQAAGKNDISEEPVEDENDKEETPNE